MPDELPTIRETFVAAYPQYVAALLTDRGVEIDSTIADGIVIGTGVLDGLLASFQARPPGLATHSPLELFREALRPVDRALDVAGVEPPVIDANQRNVLPWDRYALSPGSAQQLGPAAYDAHLEKGNPATLVLHDRPEFSKVRLDDRMNIAKIHREVRAGGLAFTGIHIITPELLGHLPSSGKFDIIDCYRDFIRAGKPIGAYVSKGHYWRDIGSVADYIQANREALGQPRSEVAGSSKIHETSKIVDWAVVGEGTVVEAEAVISRSIIWEKATISRGIRVTDSVVTAHQAVTSDLVEAVL